MHCNTLLTFPGLDYSASSPGVKADLHSRVK